MAIPLRSVELAKRIASDFEKRHHIEGDRALTLDLMATQYGYRSWQELTKCVSPEAPPFVFDQDLSEEDFAARRLEQARCITDTFRWLLPDAFAFADALRATADQTRPPRRLSNTSPAYDRAMLDQRDVYWCSGVELEHPLAPPGFDLCILTSVSSLAKARLQGIYTGEAEKVQAIIPWNRQGMASLVGGHNFYAADDLLLVEVVSWGAVFAKKTPPSVRRKDLWQTRYRSEEEAKFAVAQDHAAYQQLLSAVERLGLKCKRGEQPQLVARELLGKPWYWPLKPIIRTPRHRELWEQAARIPYELAEAGDWSNRFGQRLVGLRDLNAVIPDSLRTSGPSR